MLIMSGGLRIQYIKRENMIIVKSRDPASFKPKIGIRDTSGDTIWPGKLPQKLPIYNTSPLIMHVIP